MQQIHHKKNELFEVEYYEDRECSKTFDFTNAKNIYINGQFDLQVANCVIENGSENAQIFIPYIPQDCINSIMSAIISRNCDNKEPDDYDNVKVFTLTQINEMWDIDKIESITPDLSKYIPEGNAVLFLSEEGFFNYGKCFKGLDLVASLEKLNTGIVSYKKLTIFLPHGTQSELQKANKVGKELKEKYGVEEVNVFVLHCFIDIYNCRKDILRYCKESGGGEYFCQNINKIITTNSTGILPVDDNERLQVIDCKAIFEEYLKENNF